jgi:hypothetical protein
MNIHVYYYIVQGGGNIAESFLPENFNDIGTFSDMGPKYIISFKNEKRVGVRNDVICQTFLSFESNSTNVLNDVNHQNA